MMLKSAAVNPEATKEIDEACTCAVDPTGRSFCYLRDPRAQAEMDYQHDLFCAESLGIETAIQAHVYMAKREGDALQTLFLHQQGAISSERANVILREIHFDAETISATSFMSVSQLEYVQEVRKFADDLMSCID